MIHSLRHVFGTCMGEADADAFTILKLMGHSSVTISQRYVHPSPETLERAFERLIFMNGNADGLPPKGAKRALLSNGFHYISGTARKPLRARSSTGRAGDS